MKTFEAKRISIDTKIIGFDGKELELKCRESTINASAAGRLVGKCTSVEQNFRDSEETQKDSLFVIKTQLSILYNISEEQINHIVENFDVGTLVEIVRWALTELAGLKKN